MKKTLFAASLLVFTTQSLWASATVTTTCTGPREDSDRVVITESFDGQNYTVSAFLDGFVQLAPVGDLRSRTFSGLYGDHDNYTNFDLTVSDARGNAATTALLTSTEHVDRVGFQAPVTTELSCTVE